MKTITKRHGVHYQNTDLTEEEHEHMILEAHIKYLKEHTCAIHYPATYE